MEEYRVIRNDLRRLELPEVPSISGTVLSKIIEKRRERKGSILPFMIIAGISILITLIIWRKR
ncbi:MAG: hypothetical protein J7J33_06075 [Caldisericia bacterium]|nr:hypothetical protein [Caldisericia bacterium]